MASDLEERRRKVSASWNLIRADIARLGEAVRNEVAGVQSFTPRAIFDARPLVFVGIAAGAGLLLGFRGARRSASVESLVRSAAPEAAKALAGKSLGRRVFETAFLAVVERGARSVAGNAFTRLEQRPAEIEDRPELITDARGGI